MSRCLKQNQLRHSHKELLYEEKGLYDKKLTVQRHNKTNLSENSPRKEKLYFMNRGKLNEKHATPLHTERQMKRSSMQRSEKKVNEIVGEKGTKTDEVTHVGEGSDL